MRIPAEGHVNPCSDLVSIQYQFEYESIAYLHLPSRSLGLHRRCHHQFAHPEPCHCAETALSRLNQRSLERVFAVNAFGPILVSKVGLLRKYYVLVSSLRLLLYLLPERLTLRPGHLLPGSSGSGTV